MRLSYKKKLFLYFLFVFTIFTVIIIAVQQNREKMYKTENFRSGLNSYTEILASYIRKNNLLAKGHVDSIAAILPLFPDNLRITVINLEGKVLYDNSAGNKEEIENHLDRPEISGARYKKSGSNLRTSATTGTQYYYYARNFGDYFIRVAEPYSISLEHTLKADDIFTYFILLLFFTALMSILYLADRFGKAVTGLSDFIRSAENNEPEFDKIQFPETELGDIGNKIIANYKQLAESKEQLALEKDKIIRHFHYSDEGIAIFTADHRKIYANTHFIQYLNTILDEPTFEPGKLFEAPEFKNLKSFLHRNTPVNPQSNVLPIFQGKIIKNGQHFAIKLLIFNDNSYEITLNNISSSEKNRLLKQEMTNNIAHELKTPVSSIRGYVETLLEQQHIDPAKQKFFLERTYTQVLRLSDLIRDVALITKTEEAADLFNKETINIHDTIREVVTDLETPLRNAHIDVQNHVNNIVEIEGNHTLLYSIFRNLIDNTINYAGDNLSVVIDCYAEDDEFYYLSYYDTGTGIDDTFLNRIFDRFFRISEGRSRKTGGSGLGLSIVKNAVIFHKGQISAKNRKEGGLEFIFSLRKKLF